MIYYVLLYGIWAASCLKQINKINSHFRSGSGLTWATAVHWCLIERKLCELIDQNERQQHQHSETQIAGPVFTARCYASVVLAMGLCPCLCLSVCLSVTSRCSTKTVKRRITQTTPHDTPGTLVFWWQRSPRNSTGVTPYEGAECRWGGQNRRLSTNNRLYLENSKR